MRQKRYLHKRRCHASNIEKVTHTAHVVVVVVSQAVCAILDVELAVDGVIDAVMLNSQYVIPPFLDLSEP
jgi:hypothetical protein